MHHLGEVPGANLASVDEAIWTRRLERVERWLNECYVLGRASHHEPIAVLESPDTSGDTSVDETDAVLAELLGMQEVVSPARVAAIDNNIASGQILGECRDGLVGRVTGRNHHPDDAWGSKPLGHLVEPHDIADVRIAVVTDDRVPTAAQALPHVATHAAESDQPDFHRSPHPERRTGMIR